jgi:hypothetical protein
MWSSSLVSELRSGRWQWQEGEESGFSWVATAILLPPASREDEAVEGNSEQEDGFGGRIKDSVPGSPSHMGLLGRPIEVEVKTLVAAIAGLVT